MIQVTLLDPDGSCVLCVTVRESDVQSQAAKVIKLFLTPGRTLTLQRVEP